ncbi:acetyltransferase-like protein [Nocardia jejuensis]|uniref:acetyltransferase-like protein n=1 Tax=Nocardia jejuensis TaxID=328049 RepID=UPI0008372197|nr:acetyltransferase-like protein [Nocardia jejuensis]
MEITTLAERPELEAALFDLELSWPEFIDNEPIAQSLWSSIPETFPEFVLVATDGPDFVARALSVPFASRGSLPATGWDQVQIWAFQDHATTEVPNLVSAIEIAIHPSRRGEGLSTLMLDAMRRNTRSQGFSEMVAPVRPNHKHLEPSTPMAEYAYRIRDDGLPEDPWLRVHIRAGGTIDSIAPASMLVAGSLSQWRAWTDLPFDTHGPVEVPGALVPVTCVPAHDQAIYAEPNVWIRHFL